MALKGRGGGRGGGGGSGGFTPRVHKAAPSPLNADALKSCGVSWCTACSGTRIEALQKADLLSDGAVE